MPVDGPVWSLLVVVVPESVELGLQFGEGGGAGCFGEPAFEGLVEAFDLALGLGVAGVSRSSGDAERWRAGIRRRCGRRRIGRCRRGRCRSGWRRGAVLVDGGGEGGDHVVAGDWAVGGAGEQVAGVVVEPVEDLDVGAVGQSASG